MSDLISKIPSVTSLLPLKISGWNLLCSYPTLFSTLLQFTLLDCNFTFLFMHVGSHVKKKLDRIIAKAKCNFRHPYVILLLATDGPSSMLSFGARVQKSFFSAQKYAAMPMAS